MKIAISGANGYIGGNLIRELKISGHHLIAINRTLLYDTSGLTEILSGTDLVIHLAGSPILCRWNTSNKKEILRSRTESTRNIIHVINNLLPENRPRTFISASAIGIYSPNKKHTEESTLFATDFVGDVVKQWENSSDELITSVRKIIFRIGLVLGKEAKTMKQLVPLFKLGLGGKVGSGRQPFPFVHINDVTAAFLWAIQNHEAKGKYNLVAPQSITNEEFTKALSKEVNRPAFFTVPEFALQLIYGEASSLLLQSPDVYPERLLKSGFQFKYPDIQSSLSEITA
jgi:uncharacterized protein (TIGR01777 family)